MSGYLPCRFCKKEVKIPDNLNQTYLKCPFCSRDFDVFSSGNSTQNQSTEPETIASKLAGDARCISLTRDQIRASAVEFIKLRSAKIRYANFCFYGSITAGACLTFCLIPLHYLYSPIAICAILMIFFSLTATILESHFKKAVDKLCAKHFEGTGISDSERSELYRQLLSEFAKVLAITEEEVISDPFLRGVLTRVDDESAAEK